VRDMDKRRKAEGAASLRLVLAESLAAGGQGARDGGKTRSRMLRRAARLSQFELKNTEQALAWIGEALGQHVEPASLAALDEIADAVGDYTVAEKVATKALDEVFDGPMVRDLLAYRADLRQDRLDNLAGAAEDLRRLHDLHPSDFAVSSRLATMYEELGDYLGMVRLHEDQIMRSRDQALRGELARVVARLWRDKLSDPRETADAWRRVLRLNGGDEEAKEGLAKAKSSMLQTRAADSSVLPPPMLGTAPMPEGVPLGAGAKDAAEDGSIVLSVGPTESVAPAPGAEEQIDEPASAATASLSVAADAAVAGVEGEDSEFDDDGPSLSIEGSSPEVHDSDDEQDVSMPDVDIPDAEDVAVARSATQAVDVDEGTPKAEAPDAGETTEADDFDDAELIDLEEEGTYGKDRDEDAQAAARPAPPPSKRGSLPDRDGPKPPPPPAATTPRK
jgi:tetratricopeptide (TPR) repeat protein